MIPAAITSADDALPLARAVADAEADRLHGAHGFEHRARADRQAGDPQGPGEMHDVFGDAAARVRQGVVVR